MVSVFMSILVGILIPILMIGINTNMERKEKFTCYSLLAVLGLIFVIVWGNDQQGINWYLVILAVAIVALNVKSPDTLKGALETIIKIPTAYIAELRSMALDDGEEVSITMSNLLASIIKTGVIVTVFSLTPYFGQKQAFCIILGMVIYLGVAHIVLIQSEQLIEALKSLVHTVRIRLHLINMENSEGKAEDVDESEYEEDYENADDGDEYEEEIREVKQPRKKYEDEEAEDEFPQRRTKSKLENELEQNTMTDRLIKEETLPTANMSDYDEDEEEGLTVPDEDSEEDDNDIDSLLGIGLNLGGSDSPIPQPIQPVMPSGIGGGLAGGSVLPVRPDQNF